MCYYYVVEEQYIKRVIDEELDFKLKTFGAVNIVGPKWCGKTTTGEQKAKSVLKLQSEPNKESLIVTSEINPSVLLSGDKPRLIDEWQDAPNLWDAVRNYCDENRGTGHFILTGSTSKKVKTAHTGTGRISKMQMYPMSLYETGESNGSVSLSKLFDKVDVLKNGCVSDLTIEELIFAACRGGWPQTLFLDNDKSKLAVAKDYYKQIYSVDMFNVDDVKRDSQIMMQILKSYARNISTLVKTTNILNDVNAICEISKNTLDDYISVLENYTLLKIYRVGVLQ